MNKKFLSAILFGALMVTSTGTFVSCKDYDDDIENLQSQINSLATKSDVEAKLSQLQAAIDAAKAESAANASKIAALTKCECDVDAMMKKIQDAVDADMAKYKAEIEALVEEVEALVGKVADFVTSVELISSESLDNDATNFPRVLDFMTITEKANIFEEDITGAIEFVKGKQTQVATNSLVVRVSPTNAVLSSEMISLVNSKGQNLDEYVDVKVSPFTELLTTTRTAENNGLWKLVVTLKEKNDDAFAAIKATEDGYILYAVQVNNALEAAEARYVTSGYDVKLGESKNFTPADELNFVVTDAYGKEFAVADINNRYDKSSKSLKEHTATMYTELTWKTSTDDEPTPAVAGTEDNTVADANDNRSDKNVIKAVQGKPITIAIDEEMASQVRAIYVTLDKKANAVESAPSEWNAWNSYKYEGLNKVVEATSTTITVNAPSAINDYIGFRVYAVNYDGTLVDPDGKAFYVLVGDQAQEINVVATSITPVNETLIATEAVEVKALAELGKYYFSWEMDDEDQVPFNLNFVVDNNASNVYSAPDGQPSTVYTINRVLKIAAMPTKEWYEYEDGKAYYGTLKAYKVVDGNAFVAATLSVSFTKNIPAGAPEGLSIKTNQVENGIYNCYLIPNVWTAKTATYGTMAMDQVFNFPTSADKAKYSISFATTDKDEDDAYTVTQIVGGDEAVEVDAALIDNETKHATSATYDYGYISSVKHAEAVKAGKAGDAAYNYIVEVPEIKFETVYNCIYNDTYSWSWATREQLIAAYDTDTNKYWGAKNSDGTYTNAVPELTLTYGTEFETENLDDYIFGKSEWDAVYNSMLNPSYKSSLSIESATFTSDANGKQEYFKATVTSGRIVSLDIIPDASNPTADVASTLTIKVKDMYGHERTIAIPAVVKPRK